jgi:uncharacterized protein YdbL (DUF1318 family)
MIFLLERGKMRKKTVGWIFAGASVFIVWACVTINIYFPEATVKKAADEIVEDVRRPAEKEKDKGTDSVLSGSFSFVPAAHAQQETEVSSPAIRALKESLRARFPKLQPLFERGSLGEANNGFIEIREEAGLSLKEKADLRSLAKEENTDRKSLYAEVAGALNIESSQIPRIQKIFAESWIRNSQPGWWVQNEDGTWVKKS